MTQLNDTTAAAEVDVPPVEPADILQYLARSVARDMRVLTFATSDGMPWTVEAAAEVAAHGMNGLIGALMQAEGLTVEKAQARANALIIEQGQRDDLISKLMHVGGLTLEEAKAAALIGEQGEEAR
ncbi:hypothetical protein [Nonomuraea sp. NPDC049141]|uniref:hypothetical protein n=1 Tax=Nonomuraea sp. NPDC049141 TaxID=3155500 RepID=UPI0033E5E6CA